MQNSGGATSTISALWKRKADSAAVPKSITDSTSFGISTHPGRIDIRYPSFRYGSTERSDHVPSRNTNGMLLPFLTTNPPSTAGTSVFGIRGNNKIIEATGNIAYGNLRNVNERRIRQKSNRCLASARQNRPCNHLKPRHGKACS